MRYVVNFSGGKDSTAMLLMMIEADMYIDIIINVDTTKEFPGMYRHIQKVQKYINREIITVRFDFDYWFGKRIRTKGPRVGEIGYGWPNIFSRWCTARKIESIERYLRTSTITNSTKDVISYIGITSDEEERTFKNTDKRIKEYPLVDWKITEEDALQYCYDKGFDWDGLYDDFDRVSCWCCPLSNLNELKTLCFKYPELWQKLREMDKISKRPFKRDKTVLEIEEKLCSD